MFWPQPNNWANWSYHRIGSFGQPVNHQSSSQVNLTPRIPSYYTPRIRADGNYNRIGSFACQCVNCLNKSRAGTSAHVACGTPTPRAVGQYTGTCTTCNPQQANIANHGVFSRSPRLDNEVYGPMCSSVGSASEPSETSELPKLARGDSFLHDATTEHLPEGKGPSQSGECGSPRHRFYPHIMGYFFPELYHFWAV